MKTRKPLARGNIYQFYGYPTKIRIKYVVFRGHLEDDGGLEGVAVEWIGCNRRSGFYPCRSDEQFWRFLIFRNAFDPVNKEITE